MEYRSSCFGEGAVTRGPVDREVSWTRVLLLGYRPEPGPTSGVGSRTASEADGLSGRSSSRLAKVVFLTYEC